MKFLEPFRPINLQVDILEGEASLFMTAYFDLNSGLSETSLDTLVTFGIKWVEFETLPLCANNYSLMLGNTGL
jgi:hypothetical protein